MLAFNALWSLDVEFFKATAPTSPNSKYLCIQVSHFEDDGREFLL